MGCMPFEEAERRDFLFPFSEMAICVKNEKIADIQAKKQVGTFYLTAKGDSKK